jgi:hypothetical protein
MKQMTEDNFLLCAMKSYDNPSCGGMEEFKEDLNRVKYVKRLLNRYIKTGNLKERLILNHLIIFYNVFETTMATKMLFFKLSDVAHPALKTFLSYLSLMPERIEGISEQDILDSDIPIDFSVAQHLRKI